MNMKKWVLLVGAAVGLLMTCGAANAGSTTITFDPTEMVAPAVTNTGAPAAGDGRIDGPTYAMRTYVDSTQTDGFNTWLSNLGTGEGISEFNLWLQDGASAQAASWGENLWITDFTQPITASGPAGWTASVIDCPLSWGPAFTGHKLISYSTADPTKYIRPGNDIGEFGFSAETNGILGGSYVIWVGAGGAGDPVDNTTLVNGSWVYNSTTYDPATSFQRAITASAVPEPVTMLGVFLGVAGIAGYIRRRRMAV